MVRILGAAAGGGSPQWNCSCRVCVAVRNGAAGTQPRTQSSIAVRGAAGPWFLVNASPDLRAQLPSLTVDGAPGVRSVPFAAVLLTDAEIDHSAGLLLLRESSEPIHVYATASTREALTKGFPILRILESYAGTAWHPLEPGRVVDLPGSSLAVEPFPTGGDAPLYMGGGGAVDVASVGLVFRDRADGSTLAYAPALAELDAVVERLAEADCALVDGTFWRDDELVSLGVGTRGARAMGHVPLDGPDGSLAALLRIPARTILVHVNNTNPILLADSPERAALDRAGIEVAYDGMEVTLPSS